MEAGDSPQSPPSHPQPPSVVLVFEGAPVGSDGLASSSCCFLLPWTLFCSPFPQALISTILCVGNTIATSQCANSGSKRSNPDILTPSQIKSVLRLNAVVGRRWVLWEVRRLTQELSYAGDCDPVGKTKQRDFSKNRGRHVPMVKSHSD